jgi:hypothetical protein
MQIQRKCKYNLTTCYYYIIYREKQNEKIRDFITKIFTSKQLSEAELKLTNKFCQNKTGRKFIANIIYQDKFKHSKDHQLSEKGFEYLLHIVSNSLVLAEFVDDQMEDIIKITKACFRYYKVVTTRFSERYFLYKDLIKKQMKIWDNEELWRKWFELEIEVVNDQDLLLLNKDQDDFYSLKLFGLFDFVQNLNLEGPFILTVFENLVNEFIISDKERKNVLVVIEKSILNNQYGTKK